MTYIERPYEILVAYEYNGQRRVTYFSTPVGGYTEALDENDYLALCLPLIQADFPNYLDIMIRYTGKGEC